MASADRKDANLELVVPLSLQLPQVSRRLEVTEKHPDIVRISDSCCHVTCGQDGGVQNILSLLNTMLGVLFLLSSHPSSTPQPERRPFLNGEQELSVGPQAQGPGFCPQRKVGKA